MVGTPGSQSALRAANRRRVLQAVRVSGGLTQAEIARRTGLSAATVSTLVRDLADDGVLETAPTTSQGRRATRVSLSRSAGLVVGIDFGHRHVRVALGALSHEILAEDVVELDVDADADSALGTAGRLVTSLLDEVGLPLDRVAGLGVGLPGPVESATGRVGPSTILPGWREVGVRDAVEGRFARPVHVDNDANLGALAEVTWGAARGYDTAFYLKAATGIGGGLVLGGRVHRGHAGIAGEVGHTTVDEQGSVCRCGNRGCLETLVGGPALTDLLRRSHGPGLSLRQVVRLALDGDPGCRRVVADAGRTLGLAVANVTNLLDPDVVVVGGDLAVAGDLLLDPMRDVVARHAIPAAGSVVPVRQGALGERAEMLGAVALALAETDPGALRSPVRVGEAGEGPDGRPPGSPHFPRSCPEGTSRSSHVASSGLDAVPGDRLTRRNP